MRKNYPIPKPEGQTSKKTVRARRSGGLLKNSAFQNGKVVGHTHSPW